MAVTTTRSVVEYVGNGVTRAFPVPFPYHSAAHILVYLDEVRQSAFTITAPGDSGTVTMDVAPASGQALRILRVLPLTQEIVFQLQGPFDPKTVEKGFDQLMMALQQFNDGVATISLHGDQPGGSLHALATRSTAGFLAGTDKARYDDHLSLAGNPHGTTAAQVGAAPTLHVHPEYAPVAHTHPYAPAVHLHDDRYPGKAQVDTLELVLASRGAGWDAHAGAAGNPHGTTASQIGAAPALHGHGASQITDLQPLLDAKAPIASPTFTGTPRIGSNNILDAASSIPWARITSRPTTLGGYGIGDACTATRAGVIEDNVTDLAIRAKAILRVVALYTWDGSKYVLAMEEGAEQGRFPASAASAGGGGLDITFLSPLPLSNYLAFVNCDLSATSGQGAVVAGVTRSPTKLSVRFWEPTKGGAADVASVQVALSW